MTVPAARPRQRFPEIAAVSWEHPADRAALQSLRCAPGLRRCGSQGDRLSRRASAASASSFRATRCGRAPTQFPKLWTLQTEVAHTFDWPKVPELYVSQTPVFNAGRVRCGRPVHRGALGGARDARRRRAPRAAGPRDGARRERARALSHHRRDPLSVGLSALPILAGIALFPIRLAILEWARKAELSSDRAGLIGSQDVLAAQRLFMKMAGGTAGADQPGRDEPRCVHVAGQRVPRLARGIRPRSTRSSTRSR